MLDSKIILSRDDALLLTTAVEIETATGASFTPVTVIRSSARSLKVPSVTVYVNTSSAVTPSAKASAVPAVAA